MARPTDDPKKYRVNLRVNEEMNNSLISIAKQRGVSVAEYVRGLIENDNIQLSADENRLLEDIFNMANLNGVSREEFLRILDDKLTQGTLSIENGKLEEQRS